MPDITFKFCWRQNDPAAIREARIFWQATQMLYPEEIEERATQLCALAYSEGRVVAASTGHLFDFSRLRSRFVYYRTMVAADFRRQRLSARLCVYSRDMLAQWAHENPEEKIKGLFIVPQAEEYRTRLGPPIIRRRDLEIVLVGYTPGGYQMRIVWFPDATVE